MKRKAGAYIARFEHHFMRTESQLAYEKEIEKDFCTI